MSSLESIHNIAFVGHPSAGKTTLVDALAFKLGASARKGSVAEKTSICDTEPEEQEKQHTLQLAAVWAESGGKNWTLFDTPGYPEFVAEVQSATYASDLVIGVVSCTSGTTFNLRSKMGDAKDLGRGRAIVITHLDGENADFDQVVNDLREGIGEECVPVLLPDASGPSFSKVGRTILDPESEWCGRLKDRVMDACEDEELLMEYLENQELSEEQLDQLMPGAIAAGALVPVLVCNPETEVGLDEMIEYLKRFAPTPATAPRKDADGQELSMDPEADLLGTVFYVHSDPHLGKVCLTRIHSGTIHASEHVAGSDGDSKGEKLGGLFRVVGKKRETIESAGPGDVVAFSKVEKLGTWNSFSSAGKAVTTIPVPRKPSSTVGLAVTPKSRADEQKIGEALNKLAAEDPSFTIEHASDTHELVVHGMSDLHVQVMLDRMKRRYGVEVETSLPKISYRQTITKASEGHHRHKKQSGGRGQFGECFMRLRPADSGEGVVFNDAVVGGSIPRNLIPAVEKGIREIASHGVLCDGKVVDVEAELYDGKFHAVDSDEASFKMAGGRAFREGFMKAGPVLLEPIMKVVIRVPTDDAGTVFSDITSQRRGHVLDQGNEDGGAITVIEADVPLALMQTYFRDLKSQTAGEGQFSMEFTRFAAVPSAEQAKILAAIGKKHEEE
ncbi:MAG: elongation factor G [bacterium]|nr:elongation factor G [bacterium]